MATKEKRAALEVMAALIGTEVNVKEVEDDWLVISYDLPVTAEGDKTRRDFLAEARIYGAVQLNESVYIMPWTDYANSLALKLAQAGKAMFFYSQPGLPEWNKALTSQYDASLVAEVSRLTERVGRIVGHCADGRYKVAARMREKTIPILDGLSQAVLQRGLEREAERLLELRNLLDMVRDVASAA